MTYIQERGSTHVYHVNRMSKEEMDHMISLCVHDQPAYCVAACPFKVDTKEMLFYASKGNFKKALAIYEKIPHNVQSHALLHVWRYHHPVRRACIYLRRVLYIHRKES